VLIDLKILQNDHSAKMQLSVFHTCHKIIPSSWIISFIHGIHEMRLGSRQCMAQKFRLVQVEIVTKNVRKAQTVVTPFFAGRDGMGYQSLTHNISGTAQPI
jgi:hypothetical protein